MILLKSKIFFLLLLLPCFVVAETIHVGTSYKYKTIKSAISQSKDKDTLIIHKGYYQEGTILIEKPLTIIGQNYPILDGLHKIEIISIKSDNVTISGLKLINSGKSDVYDLAAIRVYKNKNIKISDNELENNFFGIFLSKSDHCTITNNRLSSTEEKQNDSGNGIHLLYCNNILIENNHIAGHRDGIYFEFVTESIIQKNISESNIRYGLHFMFSSNDVYQENTFRNNGAGVAVMFSFKVKMINNHYEHNWGASSYGLLLKEIRDGEITGNTFEKNTTGISMEGTTRITVSHNDFIQNGWGIRICGGCDQGIITKNNLIGNTFDVSTSGSTLSNDFTGNYWDKYLGYDLNKDGFGDTPFYPVNLSSIILEHIPASLLYLHSFVLDLIDQSEKLLPQLIPQNIVDKKPILKKI